MTAALAVALVSMGALASSAFAATPTVTVSTEEPIVTAGEGYHLHAQVEGASSEVEPGSVTLNLYDVGDTLCASGPVHTSTKPVSGNGDVSGDEVIPSVIGLYYAQASRAATALDTAAISPCIPIVTIEKATPSLLVNPSSPSLGVGELMNVNAFLTAGFQPTGNLLLKIHGPADPTCAGGPIVQTSLPVEGPDDFQGIAYSPTLPGTYHVQGVYSGNGNNNAVTSDCAKGAFQVTAGPAGAPGPGGGKTGKRAKALKKCKKAKTKPAKKRCIKKAKKKPL
jgi:hypothetical protein